MYTSINCCWFWTMMMRLEDTFPKSGYIILTFKEIIGISFTSQKLARSYNICSYSLMGLSKGPQKRNSIIQLLVCIICFNKLFAEELEISINKIMLMDNVESFIESSECSLMDFDMTCLDPYFGSEANHASLYLKLIT